MTLGSPHKEVSPVLNPRSYARNRRRFWVPAVEFHAGYHDGRFPTLGWEWRRASPSRSYALGHFAGRLLRRWDYAAIDWIEFRRRVELSMRWGAYKRHRGEDLASLHQVCEATSSFPWAFVVGYVLQPRSQSRGR